MITPAFLLLEAIMTTSTLRVKTPKWAPPNPTLKNERFAKLSKTKQRKQIAKDVLAWLESGFLQSRYAGYVTPRSDKHGEELKALPPGDSLQDWLGEFKGCHVCALGGLFIAGVYRTDNCPVNYGDVGMLGRVNNSPARQVLRRFFSDKESSAIKSYFEGWTYYSGRRNTFVELLVKNVPNRVERLKVIMRVIARHGKFSPALLPKYTQREKVA